MLLAGFGLIRRKNNRAKQGVGDDQARRELRFPFTHVALGSPARPCGMVLVTCWIDMASSTARIDCYARLSAVRCWMCMMIRQTILSWRWHHCHAAPCSRTDTKNNFIEIIVHNIHRSATILAVTGFDAVLDGWQPYTPSNTPYTAIGYIWYLLTYCEPPVAATGYCDTGECQFQIEVPSFRFAIQ